MTSTRKSPGLQPLSSILDKFELEDTGGRITREFQDYAYRLAVALDDLEHKPIYMRLAKTVPRKLMEEAKSFVMDSGARSKGKLFMWKLKQLRERDNSAVAGKSGGTASSGRNVGGGGAK